YSPDRIAAGEAVVASRFRHIFPDGIPTYSVVDSAALTAQLTTAVDEKGEAIRPLTKEEQRFIGASQLRVIFGFPYFADRFCNPREAPIWMADMTAKPIGEVQVGEWVVGWAPLGGTRPRGRATGKQRVRDTLTPSQVIAKAVRHAPIVKVTLAS